MGRPRLVYHACCLDGARSCVVRLVPIWRCNMPPMCSSSENPSQLAKIIVKSDTWAEFGQSWATFVRTWSDFRKKKLSEWGTSPNLWGLAAQVAGLEAARELLLRAHLRRQARRHAPQRRRVGADGGLRARGAVHAQLPGPLRHGPPWVRLGGAHLGARDVGSPSSTEDVERASRGPRDAGAPVGPKKELRRVALCRSRRLCSEAMPGLPEVLAPTHRLVPPRGANIPINALGKGPLRPEANMRQLIQGSTREVGTCSRGGQHLEAPMSRMRNWSCSHIWRPANRSPQKIHVSSPRRPGLEGSYSVSPKHCFTLRPPRVSLRRGGGRGR